MPPSPEHTEEPQDEPTWTTFSDLVWHIHRSASAMPNNAQRKRQLLGWMRSFTNHWAHKRYRLLPQVERRALFVQVEALGPVLRDTPATAPLHLPNMVELFPKTAVELEASAAHQQHKLAEQQSHVQPLVPSEVQLPFRLAAQPDQHALLVGEPHFPFSSLPACQPEQHQPYPHDSTFQQPFHHHSLLVQQSLPPYRPPSAPESTLFVPPFLPSQNEPVSFSPHPHFPPSDALSAQSRSDSVKPTWDEYERVLLAVYEYGVRLHKDPQWLKSVFAWRKALTSRPAKERYTGMARASRLRAIADIEKARDVLRDTPVTQLLVLPSLRVVFPRAGESRHAQSARPQDLKYFKDPAESLAGSQDMPQQAMAAPAVYDDHLVHRGPPRPATSSSLPAWGQPSGDGVPAFFPHHDLNSGPPTYIDPLTHQQPLPSAYQPLARATAFAPHMLPSQQHDHLFSSPASSFSSTSAPNFDFSHAAIYAGQPPLLSPFSSPPSSAARVPLQSSLASSSSSPEVFRAQASLPRRPGGDYYR